jgi:hypothetical protein
VYLTIQRAPPEGGTTSPPPGVYDYDKGSTVTVTAIPDAGYRFDHWVLDGQHPTYNPIAVTLYGDTTLTAVFAKVAPPGVKVRLSIRVEPAGSGSTDPSPGDYEYIAGTTLTVKATPAEGYEFDHWTLDGEAHAENPITFTINFDTTLVAYFKKAAAPPPRPPTPPSALLAILGPLGLGLLMAAAGARLRP